ncbi:Transmembrane and coiled-coil domains protein 1, partial [Operophtera brumata]
NVNEYLKLAANADKQQLQRIKAVFEKKNQKSALCIAQLQKKLEGYNKRIKSWEFAHLFSRSNRFGSADNIAQLNGLYLHLYLNVGGNIRDGITELGGSVMAAPREFAHLFSRSNRFGSADNIAQLNGLYLYLYLNVGGNIRDGITELGGSVMAAPREFAHLFSRSN